MRGRGLVWAVALLIALGASIVLWRATVTNDREPIEERTDRLNAMENAHSDRPSASRPSLSSHSPPSADMVSQARREAQDAQAQLNAARESLRIAEQRIEDLEREIEAVEQFVENIEESGDDPARHAFEGMEQLSPIIDRYESRLTVALEAEKAVDEAQARLERANAELNALESAIEANR